MISQQAKVGFDAIFKKAVMATIRLSPADSCDIELLDSREEISEAEFSVLTISSSSFRLLALFHFNNNAAERDYFAKGARLDEGVTVEGGAADSGAFLDIFQEFCNTCCGAMSRGLSQAYFFMGMSTPYLLLSPCAEFIAALNPTQVNYYRITINASLVLHATLCLSAYSAVDFTVDGCQDEESTGELELF